MKAGSSWTFIERAFREDGAPGYWRARAYRAEQLGRIEECAHAYAQLGDSDRAFAWLERGVEEKDVGIASLATDPFLKPLRSDPRFADLTRRIGLLLSAP